MFNYFYICISVFNEISSENYKLHIFLISSIQLSNCSLNLFWFSTDSLISFSSSLISIFSVVSSCSTNLHTFNWYSSLSFRKSSKDTNFEKCSILSLFWYVWKIFWMFSSVNLFFFHVLTNSFDASINKIDVSSFLVQSFFNTIIQVQIFVPKKILSGNWIIVSTWLLSTRCCLIFASSQDLVNTLGNSTIAAVYFQDNIYNEWRTKARSALLLGANTTSENLSSETSDGLSDHSQLIEYGGLETITSICHFK